MRLGKRGSFFFKGIEQGSNMTGTYGSFRTLKTIAFLIGVIALMVVAGARSAGAQALPGIGVLPFRVHSLAPMDHLKEGLQEMISGKLAETGFNVIPVSRINDHPMAYLPMFDESDIRAIGRDVRAGWIISGSITQVGVRISLDIRGVDVTGEQPPFSVFIVEDDMDRMPFAVERVATAVYNQIVGVVRIESIQVTGNRRIEEAAVFAVIGSRVGDKLDQEALDQDLRAVYRMGYFTDVSITLEEGPDGKIVVFNLQEKPSIGNIAFQGNKAIRDRDLMKEIGIRQYAIYNPAEVTQSVNRLREFYRQKGYFNIRVEESVHDLPGNEVSLIYKVEEGERVYVTSIEFEGNETFSDRQLKRIMQTSEKGFLTRFTRSGILDRQMLEFDLHKIEAHYHNHGHIKARAGEPTIQYEEGRGLTITIEIVEGPRYGVNQVSVEGDLILEPEDLLAHTKIRNEKFFNREVLRNDTMALQEFYADEGYAYAEVDPRVFENEEDKTLDIIYIVSKSHKVSFERINIRGNETTRDKVIRRELRAIEGDVYSHTALRRGTENLHRLGYFEDVEVQTEQGADEEQMVVNVNVKEKATGSFSMGAGYSSYERVVGTVRLSEDNLFGYGQRLSVSARLGGKTREYDISFTEPWLLDRPISTTVDLFKWTQEYWDYTKESRGGALRFVFPIGIDQEYTRGTVRYVYDSSRIKDINPRAATIIRDAAGTTVKSSITLGLGRDTRDRTFTTTRGSHNYISYEHAGLGGDAKFGKIEASSTWFFPFQRDTVFVLRGQWGYVREHSGGRLPLYEKFYLGGLDSMRGFKYSSLSPRDPKTGDRIGGEKMMVYTAEFRFPLLKEHGIVGVVFMDVGNVFTKEQSYSFGGIRKAAGGGLRWYSPFGPLRIEYGRNLSPQRDESSGAWEFSIGGQF